MKAASCTPTLSSLIPNRSPLTASSSVRVWRLLRLKAGGVSVSDFYAMDFDPCERPEHFADRGSSARFDAKSEQRHASEMGALPKVVTDELALMDRADLLALQSPMWWHLPPAMLKGWFDRVLAYGDAYTAERWENGRFAGKRAMLSVTVGTSRNTYEFDGRSGDIELMLWPVNFTLAYVGYEVPAPFVAYGVEAGLRYSGPAVVEAQDGRIRLRVAGRDIDIRVSTIPTAFGERIVLRLLDRAQALVDLNLDRLGFSGDNLTRIDRLIRQSHGIILATGPTGSGKTTTLYACLAGSIRPRRISSRSRTRSSTSSHGIGQMQVNPKIELTFASGLRSILRQDPDVIMVGEIRDSETAEIAIQAALTGHLVFSTLHTNDSFGALTRLVDMGIEPFLVSSSILAVLAQRLVRMVCPIAASLTRRATPN